MDTAEALQFVVLIAHLLLKVNLIFAILSQSIMVQITEALIRKRAEHNEGLIFSLEEISLHQ